MNRWKERLKERAAIMKAAAHPVRLAVLEILAAGAMNVSRLSFLTGARISALSQHLTRMTNAGILGQSKKSNLVYYFLNIGSLSGVRDFMESVLAGKTGRLKKLCRTTDQPRAKDRRRKSSGLRFLRGIRPG